MSKISAIETRHDKDGERSACSYFWYALSDILSLSAIFCCVKPHFMPALKKYRCVHGGGILRGGGKKGTACRTK